MIQPSRRRTHRYVLITADCQYLYGISGPFQNGQLQRDLLAESLIRNDSLSSTSAHVLSCVGGVCGRYEFTGIAQPGFRPLPRQSLFVSLSRVFSHSCILVCESHCFCCTLIQVLRHFVSVPPHVSIQTYILSYGPCIERKM